jgi:tetratricopeptide (TPR) repeat protein
MEKLQIRSTALLEKLNALGSAEAELTPREKRLFDRPVAGAGNSVNFSLSITKKEPESDLPEDLRERAKAANELSSKNQFKDARAIYEEIAQKAPQSYIAAINLGITERQLGENAAAIAAFRRALEIRPNDAYALTNLGKTELNAGDLDAAVKTLRKAVNTDAESHYGHYLLAMALRENGASGEARQEVDRALALEPGYLPAAQLKAELDDSAEKTAPSAP